MVYIINCRVLTSTKSNSVSQIFIDSEPNTVWNSLYKNHMDDESFMTEKEATQILLEKNELLTQYSQQSMMDFNADSCEIKTLWKSPGQISESMTFPKGSPMVPFFKHAYNKMRQSGALFRLKEKWKPQKISKTSCESNNNLISISSKKIFSLIVVIFFGIFASFVIFLFEKYLFLKNRNMVQNNLPLQAWQG